MNPRPILYVEDDENDVFFLQHDMRSAGIPNPLDVAKDGQEAIDFLAAQSAAPLPCLILLDLQLPKKDGFDVLQWRRGQPRIQCIPVIVLTSSARASDINRAYQLGANAFVVKPSNIDQRLELARLIKAFWLNLNATCLP